MKKLVIGLTLALAVIGGAVAVQVVTADFYLYRWQRQ